MSVSQNKEKRIVEQAYDRHAHTLYRLAYSILKNSADAEDTIQTVFFKFIHKKKRFESSEHEQAWFVRTTINQARDLLRKRKIRSIIPIELNQEMQIVEVKPHEEMLDVLFSLPEKNKTVLILHYLEGFKVDEIATMLKISPSAVKMRLARGREMLKNEWKDACD